jgi:hypothetical protein
MFFIWNWIPDDDRSGFYQLEKNCRKLIWSWDSHDAWNNFPINTKGEGEGILFTRRASISVRVKEEGSNQRAKRRVRVWASCVHGGRLSLWGWRKKVVIRGQNAEWGWGRKVLIWGHSAEWGWRKKLVISGQSSEWSWWRKVVIRVHAAEGLSMRKMPYVQMV